MRTPTLVLVRWHDAWFDHDLEDLARRRDDYIVSTVGFLLSRGDVVSVSSEVLPDDEGFRAVTHIPSQLIESITELQEMPELREETG